jgi:hypothetical protein
MILHYYTVTKVTISCSCSIKLLKIYFHKKDKGISTYSKEIRTQQ